jgi:hypothetical protein
MALSPALVHRRLRSASQRFRWSCAGRYLVSGMAVSLSFLILFLFCDTQFHAGAFLRWGGFIGILAPVLVGGGLAVPSWRRPLSELAIARRIEMACAEAGNALVNAVQFDRELPPGSAIRAAVFNELADPFPQVNWSEVFDLRLLGRLGAGLGVAVAIILLWSILRPAAFANSVARVFLPASQIAPLTRTRLMQLTPGSTGVVHGNALDVVAVFGGAIPRTAWVRYRESGGAWQQGLMSREVGSPSFAFHWPEISRSLEYYVEAGDLETPVCHITVRVRPAIKMLRAEITPPAYTRLPRRTGSGPGALAGVIPGSQAVLSLDFNNPVETLTVLDDKGQLYPASGAGENTWTVPLSITGNRTLTLSFHDRDQAVARETVPITIKADKPPVLIVSNPPEGRQLVAAATDAMNIQFTATDDFGLGNVSLFRSSPEKPDAELIQQWPAAVGQKAFSASTKIPLAQYAKPGDREITFCVVVKDQNDVDGPGVAMSRPLTVGLDSADNVQQRTAAATAKLEVSLRELLQLQQTNLAGTQAAAAASTTPAAAVTTLLDRQVGISQAATSLAVSAEDIAPQVRATLRSVARQEIPAAILALRDANVASPGAQPALLGTAARLEMLILAKLRGSPDKAAEEARRQAVQDLIAGVAGLLREQKSILQETPTAAPAAVQPLSDREDQLSDQSVKVRKDVEKNAGNASLGDAAFRAGLVKITAMFGEYKIYEDMLTAADALASKELPAAADRETTIAANLQKMVNVLSQWQIAQVGAEAAALRQAAEKMKAQLAGLAELQRDVLEKSKELARKDQFSKEDHSTAQEIARTKDEMGKIVEGMLVDANIFPDMIISNELKAQLASIFEDVKQEDLDAIAKNKLKPGDVPVQKEDALLAAIEATKKIPEDMEMFLPNTSNTANWLLENFDKTELPKLDNLPLPEELTDLIGALQKEQQDLAAKVQGAASNQIFKAMQQGGPVTDGPQSGYSAQGKSGNQKPLDFEQGGRSAGGREGESNGEMVGKAADDLEGRATHVRRTNDAMQSGNVEDPSGKAANARATGGGKASGFSVREGMDGDAPVRAANAPRQAAASALAAAQALIAEKTSKQAAQASLLYLRSDKLESVAGLMQESQSALREGRLADFQGLHEKIMAQLHTAQGELTNGRVLSLATGEAAATDDKQLLGGGEGEAPAPYKDRVADYYRSLAADK